MNFRFLKLTTAYSEFAAEFAHAVGDPSHFSFEQLEERVHACGWGLSSDYSKHLRKRGHDAREIYASMEILQRAWARDRGLAVPAKNWKQFIVLEQIKAYQPDVIFLHDLSFFTPEFRREIRQVAAPKTLIVGWRFAPIDDWTLFRDLDLIFTGNKYFADQFRAAGAKAEILPLAFDTDLLDCFPTMPPRDLPLTFVGNIGENAYYHSARYRFLEEMMAKSPLLLWGRKVKPLSVARRFRWSLIYKLNATLQSFGVDRQVRARIPVVKRGANWAANPGAPSLKDKYPDRVFPAVFGLEHMKVLARSKVALNTHADVAGNSCGNMRMFEATGMAACLLTDHKDDIRDYFEPDREVVTYINADDAAAKTRELLENTKACEAIAAAGHARTMRDHTLGNRALQLESVLLKVLK